MNYQKIRQNPKQFLSITSLSVEKFDELLPKFQTCWENYIHHYTLDGQPRVQAYIAPQNEFLPLIVSFHRRQLQSIPLLKLSSPAYVHVELVGQYCMLFA